MPNKDYAQVRALYGNNTKDCIERVDKCSLNRARKLLDRVQR